MIKNMYQREVNYLILYYIETIDYDVSAETDYEILDFNKII